ncbi:uncharacterized protein LOC122499490 [Leptopilina heterotoma]|uniref:uncharacterized protein LOC122499490 n=1 Tax=Leptopilina heterotoma TaxID=63436 RepID=UPI001CA91CD6|nr:uncharacterized protein LOC122499490 [Leptopilina heterotoma]
MAKIRFAKVTYSQQKKLLKFVEDYPRMMSKKFNDNFTLTNYETVWNDLTEILNAENNSNVRTSEKWQKTLSSWLSKARKKSEVTLTNLEKRLLSINGGDEANDAQAVAVTAPRRQIKEPMPSSNVKNTSNKEKLAGPSKRKHTVPDQKETINKKIRSRIKFLKANKKML